MTGHDTLEQDSVDQANSHWLGLICTVVGTTFVFVVFVVGLFLLLGDGFTISFILVFYSCTSER